ncbi:MAG: YXWGXW repeat-containing protein [Opitutus sp.]
MRTKYRFVMVGLCGFMAAVAYGAENPAKPPASAPASPTNSAPAAAKPAKKEKPEAVKAAAPSAKAIEKTAPELATSKLLEEANKNHIRPAREGVRMETAPPAVRSEEKPPIPAQGMVWVAGHWRPVNGKWEWTAGEWGVPATPISVWIEPKYDPQAKQWMAGYWQPDREQPYEREVEEKEQPTTAKFF